MTGSGPDEFVHQALPASGRAKATSAAEPRHTDFAGDWMIQVMLARPER